MRVLAVLILAVLTSACTMPAPAPADGAGATGLRLSVDRTQYRTGDPIVLTLRNGSPHPAGYNLCGAGLERRAGGAWQAVPQPLAEACTMELRTLAPGASDTFRHTLPAGLAAGEYRVRTAVESPLGGGSVSVESGAFQVN